MRVLYLLMFLSGGFNIAIVVEASATETRDLLNLGQPAQVSSSFGEHPAVRAAVAGSWSVSPARFLEAWRRSANVGGVKAPRWRFATGERFALPLPGHGSVDLSFDTRWTPLDGIDVYTGRINGRAEWLFTLALDGNEVLGRFFLGNRAWILENFDDSEEFLLHELDRGQLPKAPIRHDLQHGDLHRAHDDEAPTRTTPPSCSTFTPSSANGHARILFLHSPDVATGINNLIASIVAEFNASADNSDVGLDNFISVAGVQQVNDTFDELCKSPILIRMHTQTSPFQDLTQWMDSADADLAFLLISEDSTATVNDDELCIENLGRIGGLAWVLRVDGAPPYGLSTSTYALGDFTALHEIGHILGGLHEFVGPIDQAQAAAGVPDCARGWAGSTQDWMTIMGGYGHDTCPFDVSEPDPTKQPCTRLPLWSSPSLTHNGEPAGDADTAHMAVALEMTMPIAAAWESFPTPKPQSAPTATAISQFCWGGNYIVWGGLSDADEYQLIGSTSPAVIGDAFLEYSGSGTQTEVIVPQTPTFYFRARGCNGNGCGPWSNSVQASWFSRCL